MVSITSTRMKRFEEILEKHYISTDEIDNEPDSDTIGYMLKEEYPTIYKTLVVLWKEGQNKC